MLGAPMFGDIRGSFASGQTLWFALPLVCIGGRRQLK